MGLDMYIERIHDRYFEIRDKIAELYKQDDEYVEELVQNIKSDPDLMSDIQELRELINKNSALLKFSDDSLFEKLVGLFRYPFDELDDSIDWYFYCMNPVSSKRIIEVDNKITQVAQRVGEQPDLIRIWENVQELDEKLNQYREELCYWRKANHIHGWFVKNVMHGEDTCDLHLITKDDLLKLKEVTDKLLSTYKEDPDKGISLAQDLMPRTEGFFFGPQDYEEWYWEDLEKLKTCLDCKLLPNYDQLVSGGWKLYYYPSW